MTKLTKVLLCTALSFVFCFVLLGYASLTDNLTIRGTTNVSVPDGLFITDMTYVDSLNLDSQTFSFVPYSTTIKTTLNRTKPRFGNGQAGWVTYRVTVRNNTNLEYAYRIVYYQSNLDGYNGNEYISENNSNNTIGVHCSLLDLSPDKRVIAPGGMMTFEVTYTVGRGLSDVDYSSLINLQFGINVETEAEARDAVYNKFLDILNTGSTYETLVTRLDDKFDGSNEWTSNYIGNVGDATTDDAVTVNTLFAGQLQMLINGVTTPARVIVKHEDLDNNRMTGDDYVAENKDNGGVFRGYGCEMTMYFTVDPLEESYGSAPVYVAVYTCDRDADGNIVSDWYQIGDTYLGTAPIVSYNGTAGGKGSFITDNWVATRATYSPTDHYSYTVSANTTIKTLVQTIDNDAINEFQRLLTETKTMIDDLRYAGTGIAMLEDAYEAAVKHFTFDENGNPVANQGTTRAQLLPIISELDHALVEAKKVIDEILGGG